MAKRILLFLALISSSSVLHGQVAETITVEVVDVPVYVVGPDRKPVAGLTRESFEIFEDGKRLPLEYFTVIDFGARAQRAVTPEGKERRLYVLLFDYTFKQTRAPAKLVRAQKAAESLIEASDPATDLFAIATYSSNAGVFFLTPFLSDKGSLKSAMTELRENKRRTDSLGLLAFNTPATAADVLSNGTDSVSKEMAEMVLGGSAWQGLVHDESARKVENQFSGLGELADRLSMLQGQKHVVLLTEAFNGNLVYEGNGKPDGRLLEDLKAMHQRFQAAGVMLDCVDITGIGARNANRDALVMVSRDSGGQVIDNTNDLADAMKELTRSQQIVYLLGLRRRDARTHRIAVRVNGVPRGTQLFYRQGYGPPVGRGSLDPLKLADIIINDEPQRGFAAEVAVRPVDGATELIASFKAEDVVPQLAGNSRRVIAYVYIFNSEGAAVASTEKYVDVDQPEFREKFVLPPGDYTAKVLLRIDGIDSLAFTRKDFAVPPSTK